MVGRKKGRHRPQIVGVERKKGRHVGRLGMLGKEAWKEKNLENRAPQTVLYRIRCSIFSET
jgi:hypothetical protein